MIGDESLDNLGNKLETGFDEGVQTAQNYIFDFNTEYGMETAQTLDSATSDEVPGFGALAAFVALGGATYLALTRDTNDRTTYDDEESEYEKF